jgi:hypothetical protein
MSDGPKREADPRWGMFARGGLAQGVEHLEVDVFSIDGYCPCGGGVLKRLRTCGEACPGG